MDDVFLVIALLLFGSLLFCLCCYKVSNLLYMLYHIDDVEPVDPDDFHAGDLSKDSVANFVNNYAAATAAAASGNMPDVNEAALARMGGGEPVGGDQDFLFTEIPTQNHVQKNHVYPSATARSRRALKSAGSVTSLSVGVQCNPDDADIRAGSETCLIPLSSGGHALQNHSRVHHSNPDFRLASVFDVQYRPSLHQQPRHRDQSPSDRRVSNDDYHSGSLGRHHHSRSSVGRVGSVDSWQQPHNHLHHHHRFSPSNSARLSSAPPQQQQQSSSSARRYGSIRVAECSFIEDAAISRVSSPHSAACDNSSGDRRALEAAAASRRSSSSAYARPPQLKYHVPSGFNAYSLDCSSGLQPPPSPTPTPPRMLERSQHGSLRTSGYGGGVLQSNGPRSVGLARGRSGSGSGGGGGGGHERHIIPPPQSFEDFQQQQRTSAAAAAAAASKSQAVAAASKPRW